MLFRIFTDSSADLTPELINELGIAKVDLRCTLTRPDGQTEDGNSLPLPAFYNALREKCGSVTSAYNVADVIAATEPVLAAGEDILFLAFSSGLSTSFNAARIASEDLLMKYPGRKFAVVDTLSASLGQGLLVFHTVKYAEGGRSLEETVAYAERTKLNLCHWFTVDDLFFLKRGGRISGGKAVLGTMLNIKPVLHMDNAGHLIDVERAKGRKNSVKALFEHMKNSAIMPENQTVFICHGDCEDDALALRDMIIAEFGNIRVEIGYTGRVIGSHSGPGTLALFFLGSQR